MCLLEVAALHRDLAASEAMAAAAAVAHPGALASLDDESVLGIVAVACTKGKDARAGSVEHGVMF